MTELSSPQDDDILSRILRAPLQQQPELHIQVTIPNEFQALGKFNIGVTSAAEGTLVRGEFLAGANLMNLVIVPSEFTKKVLLSTVAVKQDQLGRREELKIKVPIEVLFEGADTAVFHKTKDIPETINKELSSIEEDFVFLFVGHWLQGDLGHDRKDVGMLIKTFMETFKNRKKRPALLLKTSGATLSAIDRHEILKKIDHVRSTVKGDLPNVYLLHGDLTRKEMNGLYNHSKVKAHVSLCHSEGFGRPLLEASLSGKPIIAPNWSGQVDFLNSEYAVLLPGEVKPVHPSAVNDWIIKEASWFYVNYSVAAQKLEDVYENYSHYLPKAEKLREENTAKFSLEAMNTKLFAILDKYVPEFEKQVEINLPSLRKPSIPMMELPPAIDLPKLTRVANP